MGPQWEHRYAKRIQRVKSSAIRELLKLSEKPDIISFGGGFPAPDVFPVAEFQEACKKVLQDQSVLALQYSTTEGYPALREMIAQYYCEDNLINVDIDNILITSGSQQALDLLGKLFINAGDRILVENPTYLGALQAWNSYETEYITIQTDDDGLIPENLIDALRSSPKFIYSMPTFQNPTGITMSLERRKQFIEISTRFGIPIVEDDPYGQLRYEGESLPTVQAIDHQMNSLNGLENGNVIYLSTFSKLLAPGLRLAWVIAPKNVIRKLVQLKQGTDLHTSSFNQVVAYEVAKDGYLRKHIQLIRERYHERRNAMIEMLEEYMPQGVTWTQPKGGLFLWLTLPEHIKATDVFKEAICEKVAFVPGDSFFALGGGENTMRLNFSNASVEKINEGIACLGRAILRYIG